MHGSVSTEQTQPPAEIHDSSSGWRQDVGVRREVTTTMSSWLSRSSLTTAYVSFLIILMITTTTTMATTIHITCTTTSTRESLNAQKDIPLPPSYLSVGGLNVHFLHI